MTQNLNRIIKKWQRKDLVILAARPAMGKTVLALSCALNVAKSGESVAIFSFEMSKDEFMLRLLSMKSGVNSRSIKNGTLTLEEQEKLSQAARTIEALSSTIALDDAKDNSVENLRSKLSKYTAEKDLGLVIVDYLQLINTSNAKKGQTREQEMFEISCGLKSMAHDFNIPIILLSQLTKIVEKRKDRRPKLIDLLVFGAVEQAADIVMFLYRENYYNLEFKPEGKSELIIAKNRHGPTETTFLTFDSINTLFRDFQD